MPPAPSFAIPDRPDRVYSPTGGLEYEGGAVFQLRPRPERSDERLRSLVEGLLEDAPYRWGDFFDLPMPIYLVRDEQTGDVFRVSIRDGVVRFHVLPETESAGLQALYDRLNTRADVVWDVQSATEG